MSALESKTISQYRIVSYCIVSKHTNEFMDVVIHKLFWDGDISFFLVYCWCRAHQCCSEVDYNLEEKSISVTSSPLSLASLAFLRLTVQITRSCTELLLTKAVFNLIPRTSLIVGTSKVLTNCWWAQTVDILLLLVFSCLWWRLGNNGFNGVLLAASNIRFDDTSCSRPKVDSGVS